MMPPLSIDYANQNIAIDFDGVLAEYNGYQPGVLGKPIVQMCNIFRRWMDLPNTVIFIFTSRVSLSHPTEVIDEHCRLIKNFCVQHFGAEFQVTADKHPAFDYFFDDRAYHVLTNAGPGNHYQGWPFELKGCLINDDLVGGPRLFSHMAAAGDTASGAKLRPSVPVLLEQGADLFRERNKTYGDNYLHFGDIMAATYPNGVTLKTADEFRRFGVFVQIMAKVTRYAANAKGHRDSARDLKVYGAMLESMTDEVHANPPQH